MALRMISSEKAHVGAKLARMMWVEHDNASGLKEERERTRRIFAPPDRLAQSGSHIVANASTHSLLPHSTSLCTRPPPSTLPNFHMEAILLQTTTEDHSHPPIQ